MAQPLFTFQSVSLPGHSRARLQDVSGAIQRGVTAIIGFSGAGKTSLLNLLINFERSNAGSINAGEAASERLEQFWVPQNDGLWPHCTVAEHLRQVDAETDPNILLQKFDLESLADRRPENLSRGERSRLAVARALASNAAVLIMDEPLSHVDPARELAYWQVVREHCRNNDTSLVFATHSPEQVLREAEHTICLKDGSIVYNGTVKQLYDQPESKELAEFLGACNWFDGDEWPVWFASSASQDAGCVRPERLLIQPSEDGMLVVLSSTFAGSVCHVTVEHVETKRQRECVYRPAVSELNAGDHVWLAVSD